MSTDCTPTVERFSGFADLYGRYRPAPPPAVAVREAVGPDMALMLNPFHYYSYTAGRWRWRWAGGWKN